MLAPPLSAHKNARLGINETTPLLVTSLNRSSGITVNFPIDSVGAVEDSEKLMLKTNCKANYKPLKGLYFYFSTAFYFYVLL
jgi:hypothetical protein